MNTLTSHTGRTIHLDVNEDVVFEDRLAGVKIHCKSSSTHPLNKDDEELVSSLKAYAGL